MTRATVLLLAGLAVGAPTSLTAQTQSGGPFTIEFYYKIKWGAAEEFWTLFTKNHLPILKREVEQGRIIEIKVAAPYDHATEDGRWDYRVTLVYKDVVAAHSEDPTLSAWLAQRFPDQDRYRKEEQRRFELLLAHWDLPIKPVSIER